MDNPEIRPRGGVHPLRTEERPQGVGGVPTLPLQITEAPHITSPAYKDAVREVFDKAAPPPTKEEVIAANAGKLAPRGVSKTLIDLSKTLPIRLGLLAGIMVGLKVAADKISDIEIHREANADFIKHLNSENTKTNREEISDNTTTNGIKSEGNTIQMTREEYEKIAPPAIDRTNLKEVPMTLNIHPTSDGRTTRKLTLEQGTTINAMIYVKTPDGDIRKVSKTKIANPGGVGGPFGFVFPNCQTFLGLEGEIQAGDIFPAPISGRAYYEDYRKGRQTPGKVISGNYTIEGQYYDEKTGKTFKTIARVTMLGLITQPLVESIPNQVDESFEEKAIGIDSSGKEVEIMVTNKDKIPVVMVEQGQDLFKFITISPGQEFRNYRKTKSQIVVSTSYEGDFGENGIANTFGGEDCKHPTVDNKEIVLK